MTAEQMAQHLARRAATVVLEALAERLGRTDVVLQEVADRVLVVRDATGETYLLDDVPFLWMGKPVVAHDETTGTISVDREWRRL